MRFFSAFASALPVRGRNNLRSSSLCANSHRHSHRSVPFATLSSEDPSTPASSSTSSADLDRHFERLSHKNAAMRLRAGAAIADQADETSIARLVSMLSLEDLIPRRAAVKSLGMIGLAAIPAILSAMHDQNSSATIRASCVKAIAATTLYFPDERSTFPQDVLDALELVLKESDVDPVTKIATVGCLGTLGSDAKLEDGNFVKGNDRAVEILIEVLKERENADVSIAAVAVGALAQIGQNGNKERRNMVIETLNEIVGRSTQEEDGFGYIREMAGAHIEQLKGGAQSMPV